MPNTARPQEGPGSTVARASLAPSIAFAILVVVIAMRNAGLYPAVFSDEYLYSTSARLKPLAGATVPVWLYLAVYRLTATCGDGFLACARILNLAVFALASGFVYLVARRVANSGTAIAIALLALAGACNTFTAYFMREALYAFGFWVLVWHTTRLGPEASSRCWAVVGLMLGLLSLVKPHALFLLPPLMAHAVIVLWPALREHRGAVAARVSLVVAGTVAAKFGVGWLLAGHAAWTLFGPRYVAIAEKTATGAERMQHIATGMPTNLWGHLLGLALLFAMPVAVLVAAALQARRFPRSDPVWRTALFATLVLGKLVVMTAAFTVAVAGSGPYEDGARLYARYYDFALPLLLIVGAASSRLAHPSRRRSVAIALFVGALVVWAATTGMKDYAIHVIDAPELRGILTNSRVRWGAALLGVASLVVWCVRPRIAPALFVFVCMPICVVAGSRKASAELRALRSQPEVHDRAGLFARHLLSRDQAAKLRVIGDDHAGLYRALFHVDTASATFLLVDRDAAVGAMPDLDADTWLLIVGHHPLLLPESSRIAGDGFVLVRPRQAGPAVPSP